MRKARRLDVSGVEIRGFKDSYVYKPDAGTMVGDSLKNNFFVEISHCSSEKDIYHDDSQFDTQSSGRDSKFNIYHNGGLKGQTTKSKNLQVAYPKGKKQSDTERVSIMMKTKTSHQSKKISGQRNNSQLHTVDVGSRA